MKHFIKSIELSLESENWLAAIMMALTLPDICGWLDTGNTSSVARYPIWFDTYVSAKYRSTGQVYLNGTQCYALRCRFLHQGLEEISGQSIACFRFTTLPMHCILVENILVLNVSDFCRDICSAVSEWSSHRSRDPQVRQRKRAFLKIQKTSFQPVLGVELSNGIPSSLIIKPSKKPTLSSLLAPEKPIK